MAHSTIRKMKDSNKFTNKEDPTPQAKDKCLEQQ